MIIRPIYNILLLPDVTYYFKADFFSESAGGQLEAGTDIIFAFVKEDIGDSSLQPGDFYPIGLSARIENIGEDDAVQVRTLHRVVLTDITVDQDEVRASVSLRPDIEDMTEEQQKEEFSRLRGSLLKFVQGYQWGLWARGFILQRKTMSDLASSLSDYLNLTAEEKYAILACDSVQNRYRLIEKSVQEFMEVAKVAAEAQDAQKNNQEQLYREAALKKQIDYLQKELDDMHPENISDVRKFEKKIEASGMNEEARKEAEKVLNRMRQEGKESHEYGLLYDYLDFDHQLYQEDVSAPYLIRHYISDQSDYEKLYEITDGEQGDRTFIFNVTMQNHSSYAQGWNNLEKTITLPQAQKDADYTAEQYLSLMKASDDALRELIQHYSQCGEPTMIVFFGDHQPPLKNAFYELLYGKKLSERTTEELMKQYATPFFIWTNYDIQEREDVVISPNYLGVLTAQMAGLPLTGYMNFLSQLYEELPVITPVGLIDGAGNFLTEEELSPEQQEWLMTYETLNDCGMVDLFDEARPMYCLD